VAFRYPKPESLDDIVSRPFGVVEASAGTGKTYLLVHLIVDRILAGTRIENILVVTFTEKATHELSSRLRALLLQIHAQSQTLAQAEVSGPHWVVGIVEQARLEAAIAAIDRCTIATIHGFCQRVLTEHAFGHGRLFEQKAVDSWTAFHDAFRETLRTELARDPDTQAWLEVWLSQTGPLDRDSNQPTGRTIDALEQLLFKACEARRAGSVLGPRFEEGAAMDAAETLAQWAQPGRLQLEGNGIKAGTAKALRVRLQPLVAAAARCAQTRELSPLLCETDRLRDRKAEFLGFSAPQIAALQGKLPELWQALLTFEAQTPSLNAAITLRFLPLIERRLASHKQAQGLFDFQDLLSLVHDHITSAQGYAARAQLRAQYNVALIDEFQDTDSIQWRIFETLFVDTPTRNALYLIGDPKQAIYGFRGADVTTYLAARQTIEDRGIETHHLVNNYRASPALIQATNTLLKASPAGSFFDGPITYDTPVCAGLQERRFVDALGQDLAPVVLLQVSPETSGDKAGLRASPVRHHLCARIVEEIQNLLQAPPRIHDGPETTTPLTPSEIFVLTRTGREGLQVGDALSAVGIPHAFVQQAKLFQSEEARSVRAVLAAIADPNDRRARFAAFTSQIYDVDPADLIAHPLMLDESPLTAQLQQWHEVARARNYEELFERITDESGFERRRLLFAEPERTAVNVAHIFEVLLSSFARDRPPLHSLLRDLDAAIAGLREPDIDDPLEQRLQSDGEAVQIMSIHKAKGLEASTVFLFGGFTRFAGPEPLHVHHQGGKRFAHIGRVDKADIGAAIDADLAQEEQRLYYVALTRAKARLYLPYFPSLDEHAERFDAPPNYGETFSRLNGPYRHVNAAIRRVLRGQADAVANTPQDARLFELRDSRCGAHLPRPALPAQDHLAATQQRAEPRNTPRSGNALEILLNVPIPEPSRALRHEREARLGALTTSYSRLKRQRDFPASASPAAASDPLSQEMPVVVGRHDETHPLSAWEPAWAPHAGSAANEQLAPEENPAAFAQTDTHDLPGGAQTGIMLHEMLEAVPLESLIQQQGGSPSERYPAGKAPADFQHWCAHGGVAASIDRIAQRHGLDPALRLQAETLVYTALTRKLPLLLPQSDRAPDQVPTISLAERVLAAVRPLEAGQAAAGEAPAESHANQSRASQSAHKAILREVEFLYPDGTASARDFVTGYIDAVFSANGSLYAIDWKSDLLAPDTSVRAHTEQHYRIQTQLYAVALARMAAIDSEADYNSRFGGLLFVYLRRTSESGVCLVRPPYAEIARWSAAPTQTV